MVFAFFLVLVLSETVLVLVLVLVLERMMMNEPIFNHERLVVYRLSFNDGTSSFLVDSPLC